MKHIPAFLRVLAASVLIVAVTACGDDSGDAAPADETPEETPVTGATEVFITDFAFIFENVTVDVGSAVTWLNDQDVEHTVTGDNDEFDSADLPQGASFTQTFDEAGTFSYHCEIHPGMTGTVTVQA